MTWLLVSIGVLLAASFFLIGRRRFVADAARERALDQANEVADALNLDVTLDRDGAPALRTVVDGYEVIIDRHNQLSPGVGPTALGMRCVIAQASTFDNAAIVLGGRPELEADFGRAHPLHDSFFEVHRRNEASTSSWWANPRVQLALTELGGASASLIDGHFTVLFDVLDVQSVEIVLTLPGLIANSGIRPTLH